jgi:hypothetical protein
VFKYVLNPRQKGGSASPFSIVTALVDQIDFSGKMSATEDIKISGILYVKVSCTPLIVTVLRIRIRDPVPFRPLDPGSGIGFFRIPDPKQIFLRA